MHKSALRTQTVALGVVIALILMSGAALAARSLDRAPVRTSDRPSPLVLLDLEQAGKSMQEAGTAIGSFYQAAIPTSNDPSQVPGRPDVSVSSLAPSDTYVSARGAVDAAEASFGIVDTDIVRAVEVRITGPGVTSSPDDEPAWVVVAKYGTPTPVIGFWSELCIVVDAVSGKYQYAYPADLTKGTQAAIVRYLKHLRAKFGPRAFISGG